MKPSLLLIAGLLCVAGASAQDEPDPRSLGVLTLNSFGAQDSLRFYHPGGEVWLAFNPYFRAEERAFEPPDGFAPLSFHPDYALIALRTLKIDGPWAHVVVDEGNGTVRLVDLADSTLVFKPWMTYFRDALGLGVRQAAQDTYVRPSPDAPRAAVPTERHLHVIPVEMRGDWVRVKWTADGSAVYDSDASTPWADGWIRWRDDEDRLLVDVYLIY